MMVGIDVSVAMAMFFIPVRMRESLIVISQQRSSNAIISVMQHMLRCVRCQPHCRTQGSRGEQRPLAFTSHTKISPYYGNGRAPEVYKTITGRFQRGPRSLESHLNRHLFGIMLSKAEASDQFRIRKGVNRL